MIPQFVPSTDSVQVPVHVLQTGSSGNQPTLVVHATGFHGRAYSKLASCLASRATAPIFAPDLRGHGQCRPPANRRFLWDGFAEDLIAVLDALDLHQLKGFGHSMGGAILLRVEHLRPGSFSHIFAYEPIVFPPSFRTGNQDSPLVEAARRRRAQFPSFEAAVERFGSRPPLNVLDRDCLEDYVRYGFHSIDADAMETSLIKSTSTDSGSIAPGSSKAGPVLEGSIELNLAGVDEAKLYQVSLDFDVWDHLPEIAAKTTVGHGRINHPGPASIAALIAERIPNSTVLTFDHLAHFGPLQDPATIAHAIAQQFQS